MHGSRSRFYWRPSEARVCWETSDSDSARQPHKSPPHLPTSLLLRGMISWWTVGIDSSPSALRLAENSETKSKFLYDITYE